MSEATPPTNSARRPSANPSTPSSGSQNRSPTRSSNPPTTPARSSTLKSKTGPPASAKAAAKKTIAKESESKADEDAKAETAALIEDLKGQLRKTESASEEYQKQLEIAQSRLDEALSEQNKLEESRNEHAETITSLESQVREISRQKTDLEAQREANEGAWVSEREAASGRESELQDIIQRLKENLAQREPRRSTDGGGRSSPYPEATGLSSPPLSRRDSSQSGIQTNLQKDRMIEELRLELAEAQIKIMEVDRAGGGRLQELEKKLLDVRMTNAKLLEDNESYQFLLQERTLNGDFANKFRAATPSEQSTVSREAGSASLADELETVSEAGVLEDVKERRTIDKAEKDIALLEDENKAMKLYIDKIMGKILASEHYEAVLGGPNVHDGDSPLNVPPKERQGSTADDEANTENVAQSLLQRAGSIFGGGRARPRPRSQIGAQGQATGGAENPPPESQDQSGYTARPAPVGNENPTTAPSVPLRRGDSTRTSMASRSSHRRSTSEWTASTPSYTTRTPSGGNRPVTPTNQSSLRQSSLSTSSPPAGLVIIEDDGDDPSALETAISTSDADAGPQISRTASDSGYGESADTLSVPSTSPSRSVGASSGDGGRSGGGGASVASSKQMRPLRLVQEKAEAEAEKRRLNRSSWVGWFNRAGFANQAPPPSSDARSGSGSGGG